MVDVSVCPRRSGVRTAAVDIALKRGLNNAL